MCARTKLIRNCFTDCSDWYYNRFRTRREKIQLVRVLVVSVVLGVLLISASVVLLRIGLPVYRHYTEADGFIPARCAIEGSFPGTGTTAACGGEECEVCTTVKVVYDAYDDQRMMNSSVGRNESQNTGHLNPDETTIRTNGWCYVKSFPCFNDIHNCSFDCLFNPNNRDQVIERRRLTKADVINVLFWPSLAILMSHVYFILLIVIQNVNLAYLVERRSGCLLEIVLTLGSFSHLHLRHALRLSTHNRSSRYVRILYRHGAQNNLRNTALIKSCKEGFALTVERLLERGADVNVGVSSHKETVLHVAAQRGHYDCVLALLKHSADVNACYVSACTPLHLACKYAGQPEHIVDALIDAGSNVNSRDLQKRTALHYASVRGFTRAVEALLEAGVELFARDHLDHTALDLAIYNLHYNVVVAIVRDNSMFGKLVLTTAAETLYRTTLYRTKLQRESLEISKTLLIAGCVAGPVVFWIKTLDPQIDCTAELVCYIDWLGKFRENPQSLKSLCRLVIRQAIGRRIVSSVDCLPLPKSGRDYVSLNEFLRKDHNGASQRSIATTCRAIRSHAWTDPDRR